MYALLKWSSYLIAAIFVCVLALFAGLASIPSTTLYHPLTIDKNSLIIELGQIEELGPGGFYYAVYVYREMREDRAYSEFERPVMWLSRVDEDSLRLRYDGKCYVLEADYKHLYYINRHWRDFFIQKELCFDLIQLGAAAKTHGENE